MNTTRASRPIPLGLTALVAFFSALAALGVASGQSAHAHGDAHHEGHAPATMTTKEAALRSDLRRLWEDHIVWTRLAIISLTTDAPDTKATVGRLLKNQTDLGNAIKPFYGAAAGKELTRLLRAHILVAADVIAAAQAGDKARLAEAQTRWERNADDIAALLHRANPRFWKLAAMKAEMREHLKLTTQEVVARLQRRWGADVAAYDRVHNDILHMSDLLASGLAVQFPARFR